MFRLQLRLHGAEIQEIPLDAGREYTFGRGDSCDVQLVEGKSISRVHFRIVEENGQWTAQVVSKFGTINHSGSAVNQLVLEPGVVFKVGPYDFTLLDPAKPQEIAPPVSNTLPMAVGQSHGRNYVQQGHGHEHGQNSGQNNGHGNGPNQAPDFGGGAGSGQAPPASGFAGNDEATRVAAYEPEIPFLRMVEPGGRNEEIRLEGRRWTAGREDGCHILLNDRKSSRRQFELSSTPQGYFIRDLGSSNGTLLNGIALAHDELKAIRSGDVIQVGATVLHFEVRDPHFNTKLMVVPPDDFGGVVMQNPYEMINYPVVQGPGGAVRMDGNQWLQPVDGFQLPFTQGMDPGKKKKVRFYLLAAILLIPLVLVLMFTGNEPPKKPGRKSTPSSKNFRRNNSNR